jgi:TolB protein
MKTFSRPAFLFFLSLSVAVLPSSQAQVTVESTGKVPVAVASFSGASGAEAAKILTADLQRTLLIQIVSASAAKFEVSGSADAHAVTGRLVNTATKSEVFNQTFSGDLRSAAHQLADAVTLATTGVQGFATSRVAFISNATGSKELYVMDIDGANIKRLTSDKTISASPAWSKDGTQLAYTSYKSGYPDVYLIHLAEKSRNRVAFFPGINSGASFSPDGQNIALTLSKDGNPEIYTLPTSGGTPARLTRTRGSETSPTWSPDGSRIAYTSDDRGSAQLYISALSGGESERLFTGSAFSSEPDWSPDGKAIAYTLRTSGAFQIGLYDMATRKGAQITSKGGEDPSWTRNSRHLIYAYNGGIYLLDTVSQQSIKLENGLGGCTEPVVSR